jgi:hypothetical protein
MKHLAQPVEMHPTIEVHARDLERKAETIRLEKLKARLCEQVQDQQKMFQLWVLGLGSLKESSHRFLEFLFRFGAFAVFRARS